MFGSELENIIVLFFERFKIIPCIGIISSVLGKDGFYFKVAGYKKVALLRNRTLSPGQDRVPWKVTSPPLHGHPPSARFCLVLGEGYGLGFPKGKLASTAQRMED